MKFNWKTEALSLVILAAMLLLAVATWSGAPDRIPVHWDFSGTVDRYGGKFEGLAGPPLLAVGIYLVLLFAPRIDPRRANYDAFAGPYAVIRTSVVALIFGIYIMAQLVIRGHAVPVNVVVSLAVGLMFLVLGNYLPKVTSNWFVGVRTPWTLSSEESWRRTHQVAGRLFLLSGVVIILTALFIARWSAIAIIGSVAISAGVSVVYSYFAWKQDRARTAP